MPITPKQYILHLSFIDRTNCLSYSMHFAKYVREWNTKPKLCHIAQFVLFQVFSILSPTEIVEMKGIGELLEGLILYS
ncbi:putative small-subunit processome, Utp13 protein [Helianthus annuus]|nr:putative small-subunit processome, Utp13 protein [Helianthus annuus]